MESDPIKPRRPWLAGLLSLTGVPIGQLYAGHPIRAITLAILLLSAISRFLSLPFVPRRRRSISAVRLSNFDLINAGGTTCFYLLLDQRLDQ